MSDLAIICSGQGRQDAAMIERLLKYPEAKTLLQRIRAAGVLPDRATAWLEKHADAGDSIFLNEIAQPMICLYQVLAWEVIKPLLPAPDIFMGYSLGELSAYGCAGVLDPAELVRLAGIRGRLMTGSATVPQTMVAVIGLSRWQVGEICADFNAQIAIINAADHFIIGLPLEHLAPILAACEKSGATKTIHLPVTVAAHTVFMESAAGQFGQALLSVDFNAAPGNILAGVSGEKVFSKDRMIATLAGQIHNTIDWRACMESAISYNCRVFLELGPGDSLAKMALSAFPGIEARSIAEFHDLHAVSNWVNAALGRS